MIHIDAYTRLPGNKELSQWKADPFFETPSQVQLDNLLNEAYLVAELEAGGKPLTSPVLLCIVTTKEKDPLLVPSIQHKI